jgi:opacity protein-like surface antigen
MAVSAQSQIKFGIRAGLTSSTVEADKIEFTNSNTTIETANDAKVGIQFGLFSQITLGGLFIQPELLLATSGGVIKVHDITNNTTTLKDQRFTKVDLPVLVGAKMGPLRIGVGPVASMVLNSKSELTDLSGYDDKFKKATFGYQAGIGLDIWKLAIDLKYEGNLSKLGDGVTVAGEKRSFDSRTRQWILGVAYKF